VSATPFALCFIALVVCQRLIELAVARRHTRILEAQGAIQIGRRQYRWFIVLHAAFFAALTAEVLAHPILPTRLHATWLALFLGAQLLRLWAMRSLGVFWNTRILVMENAEPIAKGPYRWIRHPNYLAVTIELISLPLVFDAWLTAIVFSIWNWLLIRRRVALEEAALSRFTSYAGVHEHRARGFFWGRRR